MTRFSVGVGSSVTFGFGTRCRRFLRRHVVGVCTRYERGVPALPTTVPPILASCTHTWSPADNVLNGCARWYRSYSTVCRVLMFSWRSRSCFDSSHQGCSVDAITGIDVLSCRPISSWAGEYPHSSDVVRYANSAPYGSTNFFSIALTVCTVRSALPLL